LLYLSVFGEKPMKLGKQISCQAMSLENIVRDKEYFLELIRSDLAIYWSIPPKISRQSLTLIVLHNFMIATAHHNQLFLPVNRM
jgi:hypothetical protein